MLDGVNRVVVIALAAVGAMFAANSLYSKVIRSAIELPATRTDGDFNTFRRDAEKANPGKAPVIALTNYAKDFARNEMANTADPEQRAGKAAAFFMGFYLVNTRARVEYCRQKGVDISEFASAFASSWRPAHAKATAVLERHGVDEEKVWQASKSDFMQAVAMDMSSIGFVPGFKSPCDLLAKKPMLVVDKLDFNARAPEAMRVLMGS